MSRETILEVKNLSTTFRRGGIALPAVRDVTFSLGKGEVLAVARVAGIQAAKRCSELIPLCHPLPLSEVQIDFETQGSNAIRILATCHVTGKTGVEMEALTAVSVAALTIYDMAKAVDKGMTINGTRLLKKTGGKSGVYERSDV